MFKALADPTRRLLLDALFVRGGRTLGDLESVVTEHTEMTRFGVSSTCGCSSRPDSSSPNGPGARSCTISTVPIRLIHNRWIDKFTEHHTTALTELKHQLEEQQ